MKPEWLDAYIASSWVFDKRAFEALKDALKPHEAAYRKIYEPLRHRRYAHRPLNPSQPVADLFAQTNRAELGKTLLFLRDLAETIGQTFVNGKPLTLGRSDYQPDRTQIRSAIRGVLGRIVSSQLSTVESPHSGSRYVDQSSPR